MMGPEKLSVMRARMREAFEMSDTSVAVWFEQQLNKLRVKPKENKSRLEALRLLRDALVEKGKRPQSKKKKVCR